LIVEVHERTASGLWDGTRQGECTITAAAIVIGKDHQINIIDTPN